MKTFIITTVLKCSDQVEERKPDVRMIYQYLNTLKKEGYIKRQTLRGNVVLNIEKVVHDVMEVE